MPVTGGSVAMREAHATAVAIVLAELLMGRSCTAEQLQAWSDTIPDCAPNWLAYELTCDAPAWWVGHMGYVEQRWAEVAHDCGMDGESFRPMRPMFYPQFYEKCAAHVRAHHRLPEATP